MSQFLLEFFSEEVPARMQVAALAHLESAFREGLTKAGLAAGAITSFSTPRRMGLAIDGLPTVQEDRSEEHRGPRVGAPEAALQGFLKSRGVTLDQCVQQKTDKGDYWVYLEQVKGQPVEKVLAQITSDIIASFPWPKSMRWSTYALRWVRPLLSILAIFDGKVIDLTVPQTDADFRAGHTTRGHRFLAPAQIEVKDFADYQTKLRAAHVLIDRAERRAKIVEQAQALAAEHGLTLRADEALIDELTGLVEWPTAMMGTFPESFLEAPAEALIASMRGHQKYLSLLTKEGKLSNRFILISNMTAEGVRAANIVAGNEKVLKARLSDALFFWQQDLKAPLEARTAKLSDIVFHAKLGTVEQKTARLVTLAQKIAAAIDADVTEAARAAQLCKCDLVTSMVGEFPELQGLMGMYYARHQGEKPAVAAAIADHYKPAGAADDIPSQPVSIALALADKIDTITGFFAIDEKPTGSKDPYALRRAALGIIRIVLGSRLNISLRALFVAALSSYIEQGHAAVTGAVKGSAADKAVDAFGILPFILDRLKHSLKDSDIRADVVDAVLAHAGDTSDLAQLHARMRSVTDFLSAAAGASLLAGYKRAANIVKIEQDKDKTVFSGEIKENLLRLPQEVALFKALTQVQNDIAPLLARNDYTLAMTKMAALQQPVDGFFAEVIVNDNDHAVRENRLNLLTRIQRVANSVADFSCIK